MNDFGKGVLAIIGAVITLATISVILSRNAQTAQLLQAAGSALGNVIGAATQPVTNPGAARTSDAGGNLSGLPIGGIAGSLFGTSGLDSFGASSFFSA